MPSSGQFVVQDDGTIGLSSGGASKVFTTGGACDECCGEPTCSGDGVDCAFCGTTPSEQYNVTFSGVTLCTGCKDEGSTSVRLSWTAGDVLNATHTVTQDLVSTCYWPRMTLANAVTQTTYTDDTCTTVDAVRNCDLFIYIEKISSTEWLVFASIDAINETDMFYAVATVAADDCDTTFAVGNEQDGVTFDCFDAGPSGFGNVAATGGSVTVVCQ